VAVVGGVRRSLRGREAFQEADIEGSVGRLAKWAGDVTEPPAFPDALREALKHALSGRPGPVVLTVPEDVFDEPPGEGLSVTPQRGIRTLQPDVSSVRGILHLLAGGRSPVILAGAGVLRSNASSDLVRLAETLSIPVIAAWRRPDVFPNDHAYYLGMTGLGAPPTVADRLEEWFATEACDGFVLAATHVPGAYEDFVHLVVPELQRRGLFRREYAGPTLRENLGLPRARRGDWLPG